MDQVNKFFFSVAVLQLFADVSEVVDVELSLGLNVKDSEVSIAAIFSEGASLDNSKITSLVVSSLRNLSKSRAVP